MPEISNQEWADMTDDQRNDFQGRADAAHESITFTGPQSSVPAVNPGNDPGSRNSNGAWWTAGGDLYDLPSGERIPRSVAIEFLANTPAPWGGFIGHDAAQRIYSQSGDFTASGGSQGSHALQNELRQALDAYTGDEQSRRDTAANTDLTRDYFDFTRLIADGMMDSAAADRLIATRRLDMEEQIGNIMLNWSQQDRDRFNTIYGDFEKEFVSEARAGKDPGVAAERAMAGVTQQFNRAREASEEGFRGRGISSDSPQSVSTQRGLGIGEALGRVSAADQARRATESENFARKQVALGLGLRLPSEAASQAATAGGLFGGGANLLNASAGALSGAAGIAGDGAQGYGNSLLNRAGMFRQQASTARGIGLNQGAQMTADKRAEAAGWGELTGDVLNMFDFGFGG